jgi:hypothetical protein
MKRIPFFPLITVVAAAVISFSSCKKLDTLKGLPDNSVIYAVQASQPTFPISVKLIADTQSYIFSAGYGGLGTPGKDVQVSFSLDPGALTAYNATLSSGGLPAYTLLPASNYTAALNGTIPANGVLTRPLPLKIRAVGLNSKTNYALPLTLSSAGGLYISPSNKTIMFVINGPDNIYAGAYRATGTRTNYSATGTATGTSTYDFVKNLSTVAADTSAVDAIANLGANRANSAFYTTVNPATNNVTVSGYIDNPANPIDNAPGLPSTYDPATKTFRLNYRYVLNTSGGIYRIMNETLAKQ